MGAVDSYVSLKTEDMKKAIKYRNLYQDPQVAAALGLAKFGFSIGAILIRTDLQFWPACEGISLAFNPY